jgi:hypothetical protein
MIDSNSLAGIHNKQHARYYEWWRKYLLLKYAYRIAWGLSLIPGILQLRYHDLKYLQGSLLLVAFCLTLRFYTGSSKGKCHNCGLSLVELSAIGKGTTLSRAV